MHPYSGSGNPNGHDSAAAISAAALAAHAVAADAAASAWAMICAASGIGATTTGGAPAFAGSPEEKVTVSAEIVISPVAMSACAPSAARVSPPGVAES